MLRDQTRASLEIASDICPAEKVKNRFCPAKLSILPDILSDGRFLLPLKMSGYKMYMSGSDPYGNNFCPPDRLRSRFLLCRVFVI